MSTRKSYSAGHFELSVDGSPMTSFVKSVEGGYVRTSTIDEPMGHDLRRVKHTSVAEIEPFSIELGMAGSEPILDWIQLSWNRNFARRDGQITHADFNLHQTFVHQFYQALLTETTFPALDGSSKDPAFLKIKLQPEHVTAKKEDSDNRVDGGPTTKQKMWLCSSFRLTLDHVPGLEHVNKIESFTVKQGIKKLYTGKDRFPQIEPTKLEFPNIVGTISLRHADGLHKWYDRYVAKGEADPSAQTSGALEFLSPDRKDILFRVTLFEVGIHHLEITSSQANADQIKRAKFELYVGRMDIDGKFGLGTA
jgi:hypothetical protein